MTNTSAGRRITLAVSDPYSPTSLGGRARARRWARFMHAFPALPDMRVLDLGGTVQFWETAPVRPHDLTVVNLVEPVAGQLQGDACDPPAEVRSRTYDLVISNSTIEHVGGHARRADMARVVHESAPFHWIQTPYRYFPVEPHWLFPGMQFMPFRVRLAITRRWPLGYMHSADLKTALEVTHEVELLSATEMRSYFPTSTIWFERIAGVPKSMVAIKARE